MKGPTDAPIPFVVNMKTVLRHTTNSKEPNVERTLGEVNVLRIPYGLDRKFILNMMRYPQS
jgi:hypothetical protein